MSFISFDFFEGMQKLAPFGMGNPEPTFLSRQTTVEDIKLVGKDKKHVKMCVKMPDSQKLDCIAFGMAEEVSGVKTGQPVDIVYTISEDTWNGNKKLQLKIKDIKINLPF